MMRHGEAPRAGDSFKFVLLAEGQAIVHRRMVSVLTAFVAGTCLGTAASAEPAPASQPATSGSANNLFRTPNDVHRLITQVFPDGIKADLAKDSANRDYTSPVVATEFPFNDLLLSWNIDVPEGSGFYVEVRVGRKAGEFWSPFYYLGGWGKFTAPATKVLKDVNGRINVDYFQSEHAFDRIQYRVVFFADDPSRPPVMRRFSLAYSNTLNDAALAAKFRKTVEAGPKEKWARRLPVPFRSQNWESDELRGSICSPTSLSMVLEYRSVKRPTVDVCKTVYDADHRMYGNWWRAVQAAWVYGVPGYLERFGDWNAVKRHIAEGQPIIASTRTEKGQLRHAPNYGSPEGHLIVITGFDADGNVLINDPAMRTVEKGLSTYHPEDVEKIWFDRGGVGYILLPPGGDQGGRQRGHQAAGN